MVLAVSLLLISEAAADPAARPAAAPSQPAASPSQPAASPSQPATPPPNDIWQRDALLGDLGGLRPWLSQYGIKLGLFETAEILGNPVGGVRQGAIFEGLGDLSLAVDLRPTLHTRGNIFVHAFQIQGRGLTKNNLDNLNTVSGIEADATTRLVELWYEQYFGGWLRLRIGEQSITTEFLSPESARFFINGAFGWPTLPALDLPSGGPGYPLGTPAIRARFDPANGLTLFAALFNGDPTGAGVGGSQLRDASGTAFRVNDGAFAIAELRYNKDSSERNGTYRFGGWFNSEKFRDLDLDNLGVSLASPGSNGQPLQHRGDWSLYAIVDQPFLVDTDKHTSFAAFARAMGAPGDRNLIDLYLDAGLAYKGPFGRKDDEAGIAVAYARIAGAAREFDVDEARFSAEPYPVRSAEWLLELSYRIQLAPWWQLQPDFQYVFDPGGGIPNPAQPGHTIGNAAVLGLRTVVTF